MWENYAVKTIGIISSSLVSNHERNLGQLRNLLTMCGSNGKEPKNRCNFEDCFACKVNKKEIFQRFKRFEERKIRVLSHMILNSRTCCFIIIGIEAVFYALVDISAKVIPSKRITHVFCHRWCMWSIALKNTKLIKQILSFNRTISKEIRILNDETTLNRNIKILRY